MERLTTNKSISDMSTYELAHNCMFAKDRQAWYRDFDREISLRDLIREIAYGNNIALPVEDEEFDEEMHCCLQYDPADSVEGMLALLNMFAWAHADNSAKLKMYEDAEEQGLLLRLPCRFGDTVWWIAPNCVGEPSIVLDTKFDDSMINRLDWFGKVFFTTKEEAEQALADMKKG